MSTLALISVLVTAAALFGWVSARVLRVPITLGTMLLTVASSITLQLLSSRLPGIHAWAIHLAGRVQFEDLILHGMLGPLLFAGAFLLDLEQLAREKLSVTLLALITTLLTMAGVAALLHALVPLTGLRPGWMECLFFGALISPTDPIAVLEMLHRTGVPRGVQAQLAGESLFNDGIGAVLFLAVLQASRGNAPSLPHLAGLVVVQSGGGLVLGVALAWLASELMRRVEQFAIELLLTLAVALGGYALAEVLHISAPLEAVAAGLALRAFNATHSHVEISHQALDRFWSALDEVQNAILFVLLGLEVLAITFHRSSIAAGGTAIAVVTVVRLAAVALVVLLLRTLQRGHATSTMVLAWGGLRGGLSIALALAVPAAFGRDWILPATYAVVVFSIVLQGGTLDLFLRRFRARLA